MNIDVEILKELGREHKELIDNWVNSLDAGNKIVEKHINGYEKNEDNCIIILYKGDYLISLNDYSIYKRI